MILRSNGNVNKYYLQTLCMVFFPGATFGGDEIGGAGVPELYADVADIHGGVRAEVTMKLNDRVSHAEVAVSDTEETVIADAGSVAVGRAVFDAGRSLLGYTPPWGILTGIRPAKIASSLLSGGAGVLKTKRILRDEYFLNPQKAALAVAVAQNEAKIIKKLGQNTCSLYISIPFCPSRCAYCSFVSYTNSRLLSLVDDYIAALLADIDNTLMTINRLGLRVTTVYIGGGTPTILTHSQLESLLSYISDRINVPALDEFTLEAGRPDTITAEKLSVAAKYGVTRISVNPQTLNDEILKEIGRKHTVDDFYRAYEIARGSNIRDINVDLIAGLPGDDFRNFSETIDKVTELAPTNITVHTFCVKKASDILRENSEIYSLTGGDAAKSVEYSQLKTKLAGYRPYYMYRQKNTVGNLENVGYSLEGHEGLYNIYMMEEVQPIFAVGAGATTKLVRDDGNGGRIIERIFRPKYPYEYLREYAKDAKAPDSYPYKATEKALGFYMNK